jgi:hypothetical protein
MMLNSLTEGPEKLLSKNDLLIDACGVNTSHPLYEVSLNDRYDTKEEAQKSIDEICSAYNLFELLKMFRNVTSANHNSTTLWHGMDDIINGKIPQFLLDNCSERILEYIKDPLLVNAITEPLSKEKP